MKTSAPMIAYVISELGVPSETFIYEEILSVREAGVLPLIFFGRLSSPQAGHKGYQQVRDEVPCLAMAAPERRHEVLALLHWLLLSPLNTLRILWRVLRDPARRWIYLAALAPALQAHRRQVTRFHAHFADANALHAQAMADWCQRPFGVTTHRYDIFESILEPRLLADLFKQAAPLVTISEFNLRYMVKFLGATESQISIVHCGVDLTRFGHRFRERQGGQALPFTVLSIGRLVDEKAFDVLIAAIHILKTQGRTVRLRLVGMGPNEAALRKQIDALSLQAEVELLGLRTSEEIIELHRQADAFASSSHSEGLPVVCIEALALGTPTVATAICGVPELVQHERTGLLVPDGDAHSLAMALARYMDDEALRQSVSLAGRAWVEQHFERKQCTQELLKAFGR